MAIKYKLQTRMEAMAKIPLGMSNPLRYSELRAVLYRGRGGVYDELQDQRQAYGFAAGVNTRLGDLRVYDSGQAGAGFSTKRADQATRLVFERGQAGSGWE